MKALPLLLSICVVAAVLGQPAEERRRYEDGMRHLQLAAGSAEQNHDAEALHHLEQAEKLLPPSAQLYEMLGEAYLKTGDSRSVQFLRKAVELNPTDSGWENLSHALAANRQFEEAVRLFSQQVASQPQNSFFHLLLGEAYWNTAGYRRALAHFQQAAILNPNSARAHFGVGYSQQLLGNLPAATKSLQATLQIEPGHLLANLAMGHVLLAAGRSEEAVQFLRNYADKTPQNVDVRLTLAQIHIDRGQLSDALAELLHAQQLNPEEKRVHYLLGRLYTASGRLDLAAGQFARFSSLEAEEMQQKRLVRNVPYLKK